MNIKIDGFYMSEIIGKPYSKFDFTIGDIYLKQKAMWLKDDSTDEGKFFINLQMLKTAKNFVFYTVGKYGGAMLGMENDILFRNEGTDKIFKLRIIASAGKTNVLADCENCEFVQSTVSPTPIGAIQCIEIKYGDVSISLF